MNISIIGGDLRMAKVAEEFQKEGVNVYTYGLEKAGMPQNIMKCGSLQEVTAKSDIIVSSIPLTSNEVSINTPFGYEGIKIDDLAKYVKGKIFIAGRISDEIIAKFPETQVVDLLEREELTVLNTISAAEGVIQLAMEQSNKTIHGSKILIMGFGRVSKILSNMLRGIGADVYCETRTTVNCAWIKAYGYKPILLEELNENLDKFDIIVNTIPHIILNESNMHLINRDCVIIDISSFPGGVDRNVARKQGLKLLLPMSLNSRVAPVTSAEFIKETLEHIIKDLK